MGLPHLRSWIALLGVVLSACATSTSAVFEEEEPLDAVASWEEARADPGCPPCIPSREPLEKHHIFPQELAAWFKIKKIDIHAFTLRLPKSFHGWLHSGGPRGGQWNEAWRQFRSNNINANQDRIWKFAFELMSRFGVNERPFVPYYCE